MEIMLCCVVIKLLKNKDKDIILEKVRKKFYFIL